MNKFLKKMASIEQNYWDEMASIEACSYPKTPVLLNSTADEMDEKLAAVVAEQVDAPALGAGG